jgi:antirestriction protein ArdC
VSKSDRTAELTAKLATEVEKLTSSESWETYLRFQAAFHRYSFRNVLLILSQCPEATQVAGYQAWLKLGRQVRKGEKAIFILAPMVGKKKDEAGEEHAQIFGFRGAAVFDVSQTDGDEIPAVVNKLDGEDAGFIGDALRTVAASLGFKVEGVSGGIGGANGVTEFETETIKILADNSEAQQAKTLAHELGHVLLHAPGDFDYRNHRDLAELEAESVAYVVCASLGLDTSGYSLGYVAHWTGEKAAELVTASGARIQKAAAQILDALPAAAAAA